jgi:hypothetical protein
MYGVSAFRRTARVQLKPGDENRVSTSETNHVWAEAQVIGQGGIERGSLFTNLAPGAAYTPLAIGPDGRIYTQNDGHLFVIGSQ